MNQRLRRAQRKKRREMKQQTTFDVEVIQHEINRVQQQMHSNEDQRSQQKVTTPSVSDPVKTHYPKNIQQQCTRLQPSSDLFQSIGGETDDGEHI